MADQLLPAHHVLRDDDASGTPLAGGSVTYVQTGTSTPVSITSDAAGAVPMANPVTADSTGTVAASWYSGALEIDAIIKDSAGTTIRTLTKIPKYAATGDAASSVTVTPTGNIPETDVQSALEGLDDRVTELEEDLFPLGSTTNEALDALGIYGIGRAGTLIGDASVLDDSITPGIYNYATASSSSGGPTGVTKGVLVHTRAAAGEEAQVMLVLAGSTFTTQKNQMYYRSRTGDGAWESWAIQGSTALVAHSDGFYELSPNGKYEVWRSLTSSAGGTTTWTFPVSFKTGEPPIVNFTIQNSTNAEQDVYIDTAPTVTAVDMNVWSGGSRVAKTVHARAVGRWY